MTGANIPIVPLFFVYCAALTPFFPQTQYRPVLTAALATGVYFAVRKSRYLWHWVFLAFILVAFHQMDWFKPEVKSHAFENVWIQWDRTLLYNLKFKALIESLGPVIPTVLELAYLLVYAIGPFAVAILYMNKMVERCQTMLLHYMSATLISYALFPYFPSDPPRLLFPGADLPSFAGWLHASNSSLLNNYSIHSAVFPSAHVSSAFGAAFGLMVSLPEKPWIGRAMLVYACLVFLSTIYGRYHYAIDAVAGLGIALCTSAVLVTCGQAAQRYRAAAARTLLREP